MASCLRNLFMPVSNDSGACAVASMPGAPSYTITISARYVAMMKSCSTMNAVFLACRMKRLITFAAMIRCSESKYALGSSIRYTSAGLPSATVMATRCSSPPDKCFTSWSMRFSISNGFSTSDWN
mmetsp:Transcript_18247/g.38170  ORF Transcript_18247/g.38170 Transcript_18247/m.38170 type:complete len:125 (-) Transcript_18247:156-530(-)